MATKKIVNYYQVNPDGKWNRNLRAKERKTELRITAERDAIAKGRPIMIREVFEVIDGEIDKLRCFFEGAVTDYYHAQSRETPMFTSSELTNDRDSMLEECFGYSVPMPGGEKKEYRQSSTEWRSVQDWNDRLAVIKETLFDPNDWVFPDSEIFWKLVARLDNDKESARLAFRAKIIEMNDNKLGLGEREEEMKTFADNYVITNDDDTFSKELEEAGRQVQCPKCKGTGTYADHAPMDTHNPEDGSCMECPVQVQCEDCKATGWALPENIKTENE